MNVVKRFSNSLSARLTVGFLALAAAGTAAADSDGGGLDTSEVVTHLENVVTSDIGTVGTAILIVGGIVFGIGVLRGMFKA